MCCLLVLNLVSCTPKHVVSDDFSPRTKLEKRDSTVAHKLFDFDRWQKITTLQTKAKEGTELGSVTLKRVFFIIFSTKSSTHTLRLRSIVTQRLTAHGLLRSSHHHEEEKARGSKTERESGAKVSKETLYRGARDLFRREGARARESR